MEIYKILICLVSIVIASKGQNLEFQGGCNHVKPMTDFRALEFLGKWYEAERTLNIQDPVGKCSTWMIEGGPYEFNVTQKSANSITQAERVIETEYHLGENETLAKFMTTFKFIEFFAGVPVSITVLDTDYTSFAAVYSCLDLSFIRITSISILTRARFVFGSEMNNANEAIERAGLTKTNSFRVDQLLCSLFH